MSIYGWTFMLCAWGAIVGLNIFCFSFILKDEVRKKEASALTQDE